MVTARVTGQVLAPGPLLARPLRRLNCFDKIERDEIDELWFRYFSKKRRVEMSTKLREKMHDAR